MYSVYLSPFALLALFGFFLARSGCVMTTSILVAWILIKFDIGGVSETERHFLPFSVVPKTTIFFRFSFFLSLSAA
jgi:hypothetical protein